MTASTYFRLPAISVVEVTGRDADKIVNNLATNEVLSLAVGYGCETFITDVRGKTVGHGYLYACDNQYLLFGPAGQSEQLVAHIDRYTITEDATPRALDPEFVAFVLDRSAACRLGVDYAKNEFTAAKVSFADTDVTVYPVDWLGTGSAVALAPAEHADRISSSLTEHAIAAEGEPEFHRRRVAANFPWYGIDIGERNLPQEIDRDPQAISFTKGCYLGQETVARLDAVGQVQRKLVRWRIEGNIPQRGDTVAAAGKTVGRLTSIAEMPDGNTIALGFARRTHFDPGSTAEGNGFRATVIQ